MEYRLFHPFLSIPEEDSFDNAWEFFCFKLISLTTRSEGLVRRKAPDQGVDLYDPQDYIAYQCKSVVSGNNQGFNVSKCQQSFESAQRNRLETPWNRYIICTNVDLTGQTYDSLRKIHSSIEVRGRSTWVNLCQKYPEHVKSCFRQLVTLPFDSIGATQKGDITEVFATRFRNELLKNPLTVYLFLSKTGQILKCRFPANVSVREVLQALSLSIHFPAARILSDQGVIVSFENLIYEDSRALESNLSLSENHIKDGALLTLVTKTCVVEGGRTFQAVNLHSQQLPESIKACSKALLLTADEMEEQLTQSLEEFIDRYS